MMKRAIAISVLCSACAGTLYNKMPTGYYVASVRPGPGALVEIEDCGLDAQGQPLGVCYTRLAGARSEAAVKAQEAMANAPLPAGTSVLVPLDRPPTLAEALAVVNQHDDIHAAVESCRNQYANTVDRVRVGMTIAPDGTVMSVEARGKLDEFFTDCATSALRDAMFPSYEGAPTSYDLMILL
jgi:hypothetical protein